MSAHAYHFPILNHIRHGECINLLFYLLSSMQLNIEKGANSPLHQGLMLTLYKFPLSQNPHGNPLNASEENPDHSDEENVEFQEVDNPKVDEPLVVEHSPYNPPVVVVRHFLIPAKSSSLVANVLNPSTPRS